MNLLAFSAGVDSCALFFMLKEQNIEFDIAIVDYGLRASSKDEVAYAKELSRKYNKQIYIKEVSLHSSNFEANARDARYEFFEEIIRSYGYKRLYIAHQLNDQLEWFLMQLSKGAGLKELLGFADIVQKDGYEIVRPLLGYSKSELEEYLKTNNIKYFVDESNFDNKYRRNYFRKNFANALIDEFASGIKNSFRYLKEDLKSLYNEDKIKEFRIDDFVLFRYEGDENFAIRIIDSELKKREILLSSLQKKEILKQKSIIIKNLFCVVLEESLIWIAPRSDIIMDKRYKELCRIHKIPKIIRAYFKQQGVDSETIIKISNNTIFGSKS